jgi:hypothetical protein
MNEDTRVNHPSYYEKKVNDNRVHPECIELLEVITRGFPGILALDAGQLKYCYRFGSKAEEGLSRKEKAAEDTRKIVWYMKDFTKRFYDYKIEEVEEDSYFKTITALVAEEFAFDKPESIKPAVRKLIDQIMRAKTRTYDAEGLVQAANNLVEAVELSDESEWN